VCEFIFLAPYPYGVQPQQQQAQMGGYNTPYPVQYPVFWIFFIL